MSEFSESFHFAKADRDQLKKALGNAGMKGVVWGPSDTGWVTFIPFEGCKGHSILSSPRTDFAGNLSKIAGKPVLIWLFAALALRSALARDFRTHRRWALRLFLVVSAVWFFRIAFFLWLLIFRRPVGFDPVTFTGPFPTLMSFAQYLLPLGVLELYFLAQHSADMAHRIAMSFGLVLATLAMAAGIFGGAMFAWDPSIKDAFDNRKSISDTLGVTITSGGIDQAVKQYYDLRATAPGEYHFEEDELNNLGYELIHTRKFPEAVRILQVNVEAYPQSADAYDSLAEAYMDDGNQPQAVVNYQKSLQLNPKNTNAVHMLRKLKAP